MSYASESTAVLKSERLCWQMAQKQEALAALQSKVAAAEDAGADNSDRIANLQVSSHILLGTLQTDGH